MNVFMLLSVSDAADVLKFQPFSSKILQTTLSLLGHDGLHKMQLFIFFFSKNC